MLLKINDREIGVFHDPTISMKTKRLYLCTHDVDENKRGYKKSQVEKEDGGTSNMAVDSPQRPRQSLGSNDGKSKIRWPRRSSGVGISAPKNCGLERRLFQAGARR
jgi:hypothetical protein